MRISRDWLITIFLLALIIIASAVVYLQRLSSANLLG